MDFGIKHAIVENLAALGFEVIVVPGKTPAHQIMALEPHGLLISNGPGDPTMPRYAHETIWKLMGLLPTFGICLGHQLLALAAGGRTFKMKFGHRGANHPVKNLQTGKIEITSQNHGYAVDIDSLKDFRPTHVNLNDGTLDGHGPRPLPRLLRPVPPRGRPGPPRCPLPLPPLPGGGGGLPRGHGASRGEATGGPARDLKRLLFLTGSAYPAP